MNQNQIEKVKKLIAVSPLLSAVERVEWNALLELMNDKQLLELEKILSSPSESVTNLLKGKESNPTAVNSVRKDVAPTNPTSRPISAMTPKPAAFRHIMNLPAKSGPTAEAVNPMNLHPLRQSSPNQSPPYRSGTGRADSGAGQGSHPNGAQGSDPRSGFLQKIKQALSQKDLPSEIPEHELELMAPKAALPPQIPKPVPPLVPKPPVIPKPPQAPAPKPVTPANVAAAIEQKKAEAQKLVSDKNPGIKEDRGMVQNIAHQTLFINKPVISGDVAAGLRIGQGDSAFTPKIYQKPAPQNPPAKLAEKSPEKKLPPVIPHQNAPITPEPKKEQSNFSVVQKKEEKFGKMDAPSAKPQSSGSGMSFAQFKDVGDINASQKTDLDINTPDTDAPHLRDGNIKLESLELVGKLLMEDFNRAGGGGLAKALKELVRSKGFFEVVSYLEKSELYKSYLDTGTKILSRGASFEQLEGPPYMNKDEFEEFTDMLREIRSTG